MWMTGRGRDYWKAVRKKTCPAAKGCGIQTTSVSSDMPLKPKWTYLSMTQPATRVGVVYPTTYTPGVVSCYPKVTKTDKYGNIGSWMIPGAGNCNPYQLMACNKGSIAATVTAITQAPPAGAGVGTRCHELQRLADHRQAQVRSHGPAQKLCVFARLANSISRFALKFYSYPVLLPDYSWTMAISTVSTAANN